jgi:nicotinate-nucleotide adenylyltransferase
MQIALFGTSADPPTLGHQRVLTWLAPQFDQVAVWASDNPFKTHRASLVDRHAMLQCLIADCDSKAQTAIEIYPSLSHPRSLDTLTCAKQRWPEAQFTFVIGSDLLPQISSWYQADRLLSQVQLLVIPRPGAPIDFADLHRVEALSGPITIAPISGLLVSSSAYRSGDRQTVSPRVARYIQAHQLYSLCPASPNDPPPDVSKPSRPMPTASHV